MKIIIKNNKGIALPISIFVLVGVMIGALMLMRSEQSVGVITTAFVKKNQAKNSSDYALSVAVDWLEKNKDNLNNDLSSFVENKVHICYSSSTKINQNIDGGEATENISEVCLNPSGINTADAVDSMNFYNKVNIYRLCTLSNAAKDETIGTITNNCMADYIVNSNQNSGSSAGYGGYEYTVNPDSQKVLYLIRITTKQANVFENTREEVGIVTQSVVSM